MPSVFNTLMSSFQHSSLDLDLLPEHLSDLWADFNSAAAKFDLDLTGIDLNLNDDALESFLSQLPNISLTSDQAAGLVTELNTVLSFKGAFGSDSFTSIATDVFRALQTVPPIFDRSIFSRPVGLPDNAAAFATVARNGDRVDNGQVNGRPFTASQLKWNSNSDGAARVTFAFDNGFGVNGLSTERAKTLFVSALQTWADYSPLNFIEVVDPGSDTLVDIRAKSKAIDGRGNTLAFAYFPTVGDITYDTAEIWTESSFLETTVHELGHSLGLDHEDDTQAIMNSILGNRYTDRPFLFQDDINGIRSLYGSGRGSVTTLGGTVPPSSLKPNLVVNGSFEDVPISAGEFATYRTIKGWSTISGSGLKVDRREAIAGKAAEGSAWVELDLNGQNSIIGQNIDTLTGQTYSLSVDYSNGGRPEDTTLMEVFWEGKKLDTLSGGGKGRWRNFSYEVKGGDRKVSTLAFRAMGASDNVGGFIDNIVVRSARELLLTEPSQNLEQGLGATTPTAHRDPITGESSDPIAANLVASPLPNDLASTHWV
ncbi:MAG: matrixin family metalloprotease [Phormidesmis sp.]